MLRKLSLLCVLLLAGCGSVYSEQQFPEAVDDARQQCLPYKGLNYLSAYRLEGTNYRATCIDGTKLERKVVL